MFRKAENFLTRWVNKKHRKPLIIRGARQVGKSTLVRNFCENQKIDLLEVNLEETKVFEFNKDSYDTDAAIRELEIICKKKLTENSILFIDEIQQQPLAVNWLRYFYEKKPEMKVIAAGSLLEVRLLQEKHPFPVGRIENYYLGPMTFSEFCQAKGEELLWDAVTNSDALDEGIHRRLSTLMTEFMFVGGMPEAVKIFVESNNMDDVREAQNSIIETYKEDLLKYANTKKSNVITEVFDYAAGNIGQKVIYSKVSSEKPAIVLETINLFNQAKVVSKIDFASCSGVPIKSTKDPSVFKLYFLDVGLYNCFLGLTWRQLISSPPEDLLTKGMMAEQFIAQHLLYFGDNTSSPELFYWLREKKVGNSEVDFVIQSELDIIPIEVKAGKSGKMTSLWQFLLEKKKGKAIRFDLAYRSNYITSHSHSIPVPGTHKRTVVEAKLLNLPLYLVELLQSKLEFFK